MNNFYKTLSTLMMLFAFMCVNSTSHAQRVVNVLPGYGTLNEAIASDANPDEAVFVLQRGGRYELINDISYEGQILRIRGEEGEGPRPVIHQVVDMTGSAASSIIAFRSDLLLENVVMLGIDDMGVDTQRHLQVLKDSVRLEINNVFFESGGQMVIRLGAPWVRIFIKDVLARNVGITHSSGNGRFIDTRSNDVDTIHVTNSTFYNFLASFLRPDGAYINYLHWDHVTAMNLGQRVFPLDRALKARVTNSIFYNPFSRSTSGSIRAPIEIDSLVTAYGFTDDDREISLRNLNITTDQELWHAYDDTLLMGWSPHRTYYGAQGIVTEDYRIGDPLHPMFMYFIEAGIVDTTNIFAEELEFANPPPNNLIAFGQHARSGETTAPPNWEAYESVEAFKNPDLLGELPENAFDLTYPTTARSYTAGDNGFPIGDLNAYPELYAQWVATDVADATPELPAQFRIRGNYPNPFNPSTTIVFDLPHQADVTVTVYDVLGRQVMSLPSGLMAAGDGRQVQLNASALASGIYFYHVTATSALGAQVQTGRMVLVK